VWGTNLEREKEREESQMTCISIRQPHLMQSSLRCPMICIYVFREVVKEMFKKRHIYRYKK